MHDKGQGEMNIVNGEDKCSKHQFSNYNKTEYYGSACCDLSLRWVKAGRIESFKILKFQSIAGNWRKTSPELLTFVSESTQICEG